MKTYVDPPSGWRYGFPNEFSPVANRQRLPGERSRFCDAVYSNVARGIVNMKIVLIGLASLMVGCSVVQPYYEVGLTAPISKSTDYWVHPDRSWQCDPPWFDFEAGAEWKNNIRLGVYHYSTVLCGGWNGKPEIYWNGLRLSYSGGGWE